MWRGCFACAGISGRGGGKAEFFLGGGDLGDSEDGGGVGMMEPGGGDVHG